VRVISARAASPTTRLTTISTTFMPTLKLSTTDEGALPRKI